MLGAGPHRWKANARHSPTATHSPSFLQVLSAHAVRMQYYYQEARGSAEIQNKNALTRWECFCAALKMYRTAE